MDWTIKKFQELTVEELYAILQLRTDIFVVEQECPYPEVTVGTKPLTTYVQ